MYIIEMERVNLYISFTEKDEAKSLGAKWDKENKTWYSTHDKIKGTGLEKYLVKPEKLLYEIHYEDRDFAKKLGGRWDPQTKMWYAMSNNTTFHDNFKQHEYCEKTHKLFETKERTKSNIPYFGSLKNSHMYL
jgi:hypothetical protein